MKKPCLSKGKTRNTVTLLLSVLLALFLLVLNLLLPHLQRRAVLFPDMTYERLYTLTDAVKTEMESLTEDVEVIFLADEDRLLADKLLRYVYVMCAKLAKGNEHISVRTVNLADDPTAADRFKVAQGSTLSTQDVIVHSGDRYKVLSAKSFYLTEEGEYVSFNGEYRLATAILSVTTHADGPSALFAVGHGERYFVEGDEGSDPSLSAFAELLRDAGLRVGKIDLDTVDRVPEDCVVLIFCGTTEDYSAGDLNDYASPSALKKIDRHLYEKKSVMVFRDALDAPLPNLEDYLSEWGVGFTPTRVSAPEESLADSVSGVKMGDRLIAVYPDSDRDAPAYAMIEDIASLGTPPKTVLANAMALKTTFPTIQVYLSDSVSRSISPFFYAGDSARATDALGNREPVDGRHILAAVGIEKRLLSSGEYRYSYVFAAGSTAMISNEYLADAAFGNGDVMASVLRYLSRTDVYASGELGGFDPNYQNEQGRTYGGKWYDELHLSADGPNEVYHNINSYEEYAQLTPLRVTVVLLFIFALPLVLLPLLAVMILRKRKYR